MIKERQGDYKSELADVYECKTSDGAIQIIVWNLCEV